MPTLLFPIPASSLAANPNLTQNPANDYTPSGLPGVQTLAFVTERDGNPEIYTMNQNGGAATNITNNPARDLDPAIGSNGSWIAFATDREGNLEVYVVRPGDVRTA